MEKIHCSFCKSGNVLNLGTVKSGYAEKKSANASVFGLTNTRVQGVGTVFDKYVCLDCRYSFEIITEESFDAIKKIFG